jgi:hypothetical protein
MLKAFNGHTGVPRVGLNGFWISMGFFVLLSSLGVVIIYPLFADSISFLAILNKAVIIAILFTVITHGTGIAFTLVKAKMTDSTRISVFNFTRIRWLWANTGLLITILLMASLYLLSSLISTQYSNDASSGVQTATMTSVIYGMIGGIFGFIQFSIFKVARAEKIPPFGLNRFWISLMCITVMTLIGALLNIGLLNEMAKWR